MLNTKLLIVGGGAAGMAAALAAKEVLCQQLPNENPREFITLLERENTPGGVLKQCIHHGFGLAYFSENLTGVEYMNRFTTQLAQSNINLLPETSAIRVFPDKTMLISGPHTGQATIAFEHLILATGCYERAFQSLTTAGTRPSGIYTAGEAQYLINCRHKNIGERIVILGSGDMGQILARRLTLEGKKVLAVIEQNPVCGGLAKNRLDCLEKYKIPVILSSTISMVHGEERITGVTVQNIHTAEGSLIPCDALVCAIGLIPERRILHHVTDNDTLPNWITLCGNCHHVHKIVDQVTLQAQEAGKAAMEAICIDYNS
ncbi:MAG: NAD(P)/FAD-dependent oxidoreductase [Lachnospiraceae bacterium]